MYSLFTFRTFVYLTFLLTISHKGWSGRRNIIKANLEEPSRLSKNIYPSLLLERELKGARRALHVSATVIGDGSDESSEGKMEEKEEMEQKEAQMDSVAEEQAEIKEKQESQMETVEQESGEDEEGKMKKGKKKGIVLTLEDNIKKFFMFIGTVLTNAQTALNNGNMKLDSMLDQVAYMLATPPNKIINVVATVISKVTGEREEISVKIYQMMRKMSMMLKEFDSNVASCYNMDQQNAFRETTMAASHCISQATTTISSHFSSDFENMGVVVIYIENFIDESEQCPTMSCRANAVQSLVSNIATFALNMSGKMVKMVLNVVLVGPKTGFCFGKNVIAGGPTRIAQVVYGFGHCVVEREMASLKQQ